jgi:small acid-soluble spore protein I (minor)
MGINVRTAIIDNMTGNSEQDIKDTILDAIGSGEEKMLPGLGVLFEIMWRNASEQEKEVVVANIKKGISH